MRGFIYSFNKWITGCLVNIKQEWPRGSLLLWHLLLVAKDSPQAHRWGVSYERLMCGKENRKRLVRWSLWGGLNQDVVTGKHQSYRDFRAEGTALAIASTAHSRTEVKRPLWLEYVNWEKQNGNYWMGLSKKIAWSALFLKVTLAAMSKTIVKGQEWEWGDQ